MAPGLQAHRVPTLVGLFLGIESPTEVGTPKHRQRNYTAWTTGL